MVYCMCSSLFVKTFFFLIIFALFRLILQKIQNFILQNREFLKNKIDKRHCFNFRFDLKCTIKLEIYIELGIFELLIIELQSGLPGPSMSVFVHLQFNRVFDWEPSFQVCSLIFTIMPAVAWLWDQQLDIVTWFDFQLSIITAIETVSSFYHFLRFRWLDGFA